MTDLIKNFSIQNPSFLTPTLVIVTGYSGAGKSSVLRMMEDMGYYCIDNLPIDLLANNTGFFLRMIEQGRGVCLGIDIRSGFDMDALTKEIQYLRECSVGCNLVFVEASKNTIIKRFHETRRNHPFHATDSLLDAVEKEFDVMQKVREMATTILDTDHCTIHDLRSVVKNIFEQQSTFTATLVSFGFKYGVPQDVDYVFDLRMLPNPYFHPTWRDETGVNGGLQEYLFEQPGVQEWWNMLTPLLQQSLMMIRDRGKLHATIAFGCTGGQHRSVAFVERMAQLAWPSIIWRIKHRDMSKKST
jgi:UPF0042 nucleotide-binding protein